MPTITKLCFAIILSKLCLVEPTRIPHLAEDGRAKQWIQISSRSPEGERGWRSSTLVSEQVPVHFTRLPLFPYRALWAQLHPWTFTCFSVCILQACPNWLSQPSVLRRRTGKKSLQSLLLRLPAALHQHAHLQSLLRYSALPPGAAWQQPSQNDVFQTPKLWYWYPNGEDQQSFTLLLARPAITTGCLLAVTARTQLLHHTRAQRRRKHTAAQDRASPLELATAAASQQKAEDAFGYTQGPFTSYKSEKTQLKPLTSLPHDIDKGSNTLSPALLFRLGKHLYQTRYRLFNDKIGILQSFS